MRRSELRVLVLRGGWGGMATMTWLCCVMAFVSQLDNTWDGRGPSWYQCCCVTLFMC